jgi:hypothetical protein
MAYRQEANTIIRATYRIVFAWALEQRLDLGESELGELKAAATEPGDILARDAEEILDLGTDDRVLALYRRVILLDDSRWPSVVGGIYLLSAIRDEASKDEIDRVVKRITRPELRRAYDEAMSAWGKAI